MLHPTAPKILACSLALLLAAPAAIARPDTLKLRLVPPAKGGAAVTASWDAARALFEQAQAGTELVLPLPFADASFAGLALTDGEASVDAAARSIVVTGHAQFRGRAAEILLAGSFPASGPGSWALGVRPDELKLGTWFPALANTPLANVVLTDAALVVASDEHELPASPAIARLLGAAPGDGASVTVPAGVGLRATLAGASLPAIKPVLDALGLGAAQLRLSGRLAASPAALLGDDTPHAVDVALHAELAGGAMSALSKHLPAWIHPTSAVPALDLRYSQAAGLAASVSLDANVEVRGQARAFRIEGSCDPKGQLALRGTTSGAWDKPLGLDWLSLQDATLLVTEENGAPSARFSSTLGVGKHDVALEFSADARGNASATARLDQLTIGDLAAFLAARTGSHFLADLKLGDAAALTAVTLSIEHATDTTLRVTGTARLGAASADLLLSLTVHGKDGKDGKDDSNTKDQIEHLLALKKKAGKLSDLLSSLSGKPSDIELPDSIWTLTPPSAADVKQGARKVLRSADLDQVTRDFFASVYGQADFELELHPGIQLGASLPVSVLPASLVQALGIQDPKAVLKLEGSLAMTLDLAQGRPSAAVDALELHAELPRVGMKADALPAGLPSWMKLDASAQRSLTLRYTAPSSVTFRRDTDVLADLDGAQRHFALGLEVGASGSQAHAAWSGRMVGEWTAPFGFDPLTLRDVTLSLEAQAAAGSAGKSAGTVTLQGSFDLGAKSGTMTMELQGGSGHGLTGSFAGTLDTLGLNDLARSSLLPALPTDGLARLGDLLGKLPDLQKPTLRFTLGDGAPSVSLSAQVPLGGVNADLLAFVGKGASGPQCVFALHPEHVSLAKLFPAMGKNPMVSGLANLDLDQLGLFVSRGSQKLKRADVSPDVGDFLTKLTGDADFSFDLSGGLNLAAHIPTDALPKDIADALAKLSQTLGQEGPPGLNLRGAIGASLADLRLAAALPPITPKRAPKWLKSGQLSIVLTGAPSLQLAAELDVDADGDLLHLGVEGGVERQGAGVAITLKSALQADAAWESPFGLDWLTVRRFSGQLSIDALANVGFGGGGDVTIGSKDIDVFAWTRINAATGVPSGLVLKGQSAAGVGLEDLAQLQAAMRGAHGAAIPLDALPDISLRNLDLLIASRAVPEEGIDSPGFKLKGELYLPLKPDGKAEKLLSVDGSVDKTGLMAKGELAALHVGPLTWKDSSFDLEATLASQHLLVHGAVELLGSSSATDLELDRKHLTFTASRDIKDLGSAELALQAEFDLGHAAFRAHGTLDNEFGKRLASGPSGEMLDFGGKLAGLVVAADSAVTAATDSVNKLRSSLGLPTAIEAIDGFLAQRVSDAQGDADRHKHEMDALYKSWQDTPKTEPVVRAARETAWKASKFTYDEGPLSKIKVLERRKAEYADVHGKLVNLQQLKARAQQLHDATAAQLAQVRDYKGKTIVVTAASFDASLEDLEQLRSAGGQLDLSVDLLFCGTPRTVNVPWVVGDPAKNVATIVDALAPGLSSALAPAAAKGGKS